MAFADHTSRQRWCTAGALLALSLAYGWHLYACATSALLYLPYVYKNSDMYTNLQWAATIRTQGWVNPEPFHPYNDWMASVGQPEEWTRWWGQRAIFQQSPLYAYLLAGFQCLTATLLPVHIFQAVLAIGLCFALARIAYRISGSRTAGWLAFGLSGLYAPFYAYSWALLREIPSWTITAVLIMVLMEVDRHSESVHKRRRGAVLVGLLLGLGYLARESYALIIPMVGVGWLWRWRHVRDHMNLALMVLAMLVMLSPLIVRNHCVGAPLLSSSNRFAETFILGNAASVRASFFRMPAETRDILERSQGTGWRVVLESMRTHPGIGSWVALQGSKMLALLDPFEPMDNVNLEHMGTISPMVRYGLKHWMLIVPGLAGLALSLWRCDKRHFWLWLMLPVCLASVMVGVPLSRYRQFLMLLWLPWVAYFFAFWFDRWREYQRRVWICGGGLVLGWALVLGPLARYPTNQYDRSAEYELCIFVYRQMGEIGKAEAMQQLLDRKFPPPQGPTPAG